MTPRPLNPRQLGVLRATRDGHVVLRRNAQGWSARRTDTATGQSVGVQVERRGLVSHGRIPVGSHDDVPYQLTDAGRHMLELANWPGTVAAEAHAAPTLPQSRDGRERFPAGDDGDAPVGAVIELDDPDLPGWWQRQGDQWVPVDPPPEPVGSVLHDS